MCLILDIELSHVINLNSGQCQTAKPLIVSKSSWKDAGYSFLLLHDINNIDETNSSSVTRAPGWNVFIHDEKIIYSETHMQRSGRVEYMFLEVNEDVEVKLTAQHFATIPSKDNVCEGNYEVTKCEETCVWNKLMMHNNCTAPFMPDMGVSHCNNYYTFSNLTQQYQQ